jgi:DNA-binding response OmpR family regulator
VSPKILIVDDDESTRRGLTRLLEQAHFEVTAVGTFAEGRRALSEIQPDLLIADVRLGDFNGLQLVATSPRPIPTIMVTGYSDPVLEADARRFGAEYMVKPLVPALLLSMMRKKLAASKAETAAVAPTRRWERKRVSDRVAASVEDRPARILDVSYGGLRVELTRQTEVAPPSSFTLDLPSSGLSLPVDVVWTTVANEAAWVCGATIADLADEASRAWHGFVDAIA